jgi:hypothetical protein
MMSCEAYAGAGLYIFKPKSTMMSAVQREYLRNAQKAIKIASDVKFNAVAYGHQANWAEAYWTNYLKSVGAKNFRDRVEHLHTLLAAKDTKGALKYLSV